MRRVRATRPVRPAIEWRRDDPETATHRAAPAAPAIAIAQEACTCEGDEGDLGEAAIEALYGCIEGRMSEGHASGGDEVASAHRDWTATSTGPAIAGPHGGRTLPTFVDETGAGQHLAFEEGEFAMPMGSAMAEEAISLEGGEATVGPLFVMTEVEDAPDHDGGSCSGVRPKGEAMGVGQDFRNDRHMGFEAQDSMGYPLPEVRDSAD